MKIFLDVGAHTGETAIIAAEPKYAFDKICCFEPTAEGCEEIKKLKNEKIEVNNFGFWNETCQIKIFSPKNKGFNSASLYNERFIDANEQLVNVVRVSDWFKINIKSDDTVYLKLNCEGAEYEILKDLIETKEYKKISVLMVDFDIRKIKSKKHLVNEMKNKINNLNIPKVFFIDEFNLGKNSHDYFTHYWLDNSAIPADILNNNMSRDELPKLFKNMGFKVGAEIGVYQGEFTKKFCEVGLKMYAIDPWTAYLGAGRSENKTDKQNLNYDIAQKNLSPYPDCKLIRKSSMDALNDFEDESLDFVYIDGDHRFRYIAEDLTEWYKKIKSGGTISGHDYFCTAPNANNVLCHVKPVIDAFVKTYGIKNFYIIGQNDKTPSWVTIKP